LMIDVPYLRYTVRSNGRLVLAITFVLSVFMIVICSFFDPNGGGIPGILDGTTLNQMLANSYYALMGVLFPIIYSIVVGNTLIAKKVDDTSMSAFLSTPVSRRSIVVTSGLYFACSHLFIWTFITILGLVIGNTFHGEYFDAGQFILINVGAFLFQLMVSGICFCASCVFNTSKNSIIAGASIPLLCFVISLLRKFSSELEFLRFFTINSLFDAMAIIDGDDLWTFPVMCVLALGLYIGGIMFFIRKDLPI